MTWDIDHLADMDAYCNDVLTGVKPACRWEILSVQRHVDDLQKGEAFPYVFDKDKALKVIRFIELLPHVKGKWAAKRGLAKRIRLEPWQKYIIGSLFGWVHRDTGLRRFHIAYICVPRKNGKSLIAAGIGLYMLTEDGEYGAEIYCGATTEKQAWLVFRPAQKMAERTPAFRRAYGVTSHAKRLECDQRGTKRLPDNSRFEPVIGKPGDGASPSCAILDEVHEHTDDVLYDTMLTGMGARDQPLMLLITTAGNQIAGPCYAIQQDVQSVLEGSIQNDELFGIVYGIDPDDDWTSEQSLVKANPNFGISVGGDYLKARQRNAVQSPRKQNAFKTKHLNVWVTAKCAWLNMVEWNRQADTSLQLENFVNDPCYKGLDLSSKLDITSNISVFEREINGQRHYYIFGRHYLPEERIREESNKHYQTWEHLGALTPTDGETIDYEQIQDDVEHDVRNFEVRALGFDPWGATQLTQTIQKQVPELEVIEVPQNYSMSDFMKEFEALLKAGRIHHDGNPVLTWMMGNVVAKEIDDGKKIRPVKENKESKIDGAVATLIAFTIALTGKEPTTSVYENRDIRFL
ncbi:terminase large subunit [Microbulbifer sp. 2304DJ12-6]|uniref:terminase large subunit n=1 Tax=Microbulbifer sp. 2304DJ12-6 TaxID=3233340 RepID=UPI0039AF7C2C